MVKHRFVPRPFIEDDEYPSRDIERPMPHNPCELGEFGDEE